MMFLLSQTFLWVAVLIFGNKNAPIKTTHQQTQYQQYQQPQYQYQQYQQPQYQYQQYQQPQYQQQTYPTNISFNEDISARAQYAYNEKIAAAQNSAIIIDEIVEAKLFAQAIELQVLKAPASARFCSLEEMTVTFNNGMYIVSGYVDSQNSYGACIRTPFTYTVCKYYGIWKTTNAFVSTTASVGAQIVSHTILYWVLGTILSILSFAVMYFIISAQLGF